jgi:hypothetical protein
VAFTLVAKFGAIASESFFHTCVGTKVVQKYEDSYSLQKEF